jgi:hypothetical protein
MISINRFFSANLFSLICGILCALVALVYLIVFFDNTLYKILWELFSFICGYITAQLFQTWLRKIAQHNKRIAAQALSSIVIASFFLFFIHPLLIVVYFPPIEINRHNVCCTTPVDYGAARYESVNLKLDDDVHISSWYIPAENTKKYLIILIHGHGNDRRGTGEFARPLIKAGYPIFIYDQRGNGESEGELNYITTDLSKDLLSIRNQLKTKYSFTSFGVVGLSMGAHTAVNAISLDKSAFKAAWLDGLMPQAPADSLELSVFHIYFLDHVTTNIANFIYSVKTSVRPPIVDILTETNSTKIMLVAGGNEKMESNANKKFSKVKNDKIQTWLIPNAGHLTGPFDIPTEYGNRLVDFFDAAQ